jgi:hypothetical protein
LQILTHRWGQEAGSRVHNHFQKVPKHRLILFMGMDLTLGWGLEDVGFGLDELAVAAPTKESHLIAAAGSALGVGGNALILAPHPDKWVFIPSETIKEFQGFPNIAVDVGAEPEDHVGGGAAEVVKMD